jgi:tripartite-type tricarboxylate transporter receptor subunit TctC
MSKKICALLALSWFVSSAAYASEVVKMYWPFGQVAATNLYRVVIDNSVNQQHKFVLDFATGAGGVVAVNAAANSTTPAVLAHTASFFISPKTNKNATYNVNDWRILQQICDIQYPVASTKFKTMKDISKNQPVTLGVVGVGTTTALVGKWLQQSFPNATLIPYGTAAELTTAVLGGHVDMIVSLPGDVLNHHTAGTMNILGVTGKTPIQNIPTFGSQGYKGAEELVGAYYILVNKKVDVKLQEQWKTLFNSVNQQELDKVSNQNFCTPSRIAPKDLDAQFIKTNDFWTALTK